MQTELLPAPLLSHAVAPPASIFQLQMSYRCLRSKDRERGKTGLREVTVTCSVKHQRACNRRELTNTLRPLKTEQLLAEGTAGYY